MRPLLIAVLLLAASPALAAAPGVAPVPTEGTIGPGSSPADCRTSEGRIVPCAAEAPDQAGADVQAAQPPARHAGKPRRAPHRRRWRWRRR